MVNVGVRVALTWNKLREPHAIFQIAWSRGFARWTPPDLPFLPACTVRPEACTLSRFRRSESSTVGLSLPLPLTLHRGVFVEEYGISAVTTLDGTDILYKDWGAGRP